MPIIRNAHSFDDHFTRIPNYWVRDSRLSLAAIGLITQIMSHKPGWSISQESLGLANNMGRDGIRTLLNELMSNGYLTRSDERERNESGHLAGYTYWTSSPEFNDTTTAAEPTLAEPTLVEPTLVETTHKKNIIKEEHIKEKQVTETVSTMFEQFWTEYPKAPEHRTERKADAQKEFKAALTRASFDEILAGTIAHAKDPKENRFKLIAVKWLRNDGWQDATTVTQGKSIWDWEVTR